MKNIATKIFICASLAFGIIGITLVIVGGPDGDDSSINMILMRMLMITVFVILPSFALSVASKYLKS